MSKKTISLRLDEDNLQMIKLFCELNGNTVSDYIQTLVENDLSFSVGLKRSKLFIGKGCLFYPCFLTNDHLHELGILFNQKFGNHGNKTLIKVRKGMLNLGLDFEIGCYNQIEGKDYLTRSYSFSINPNWDIVNLFDYWGFNKINLHECSNNGIIHCEQLLDSSNFPWFKIFVKKNIVNYDGDTVQVNSFFKRNEWQVIYEEAKPLIGL